MARILILSDDRSFGDGLRANLGPADHEFIQVEDEREALSIALVTPLHLFIVDFSTEGVNGLKIIETFKSDSALSEVVVLIVSDIGDMAMITRCIRVGADDYLIKPLHPVILSARVLALLDRQKKHDREARKKRRFEVEHSRLKLKLDRERSRNESAEQALIFAMCKLAESRDPETGEHLERMQQYSHIVGHQLLATNCFEEELTPEFLSLLYTASPVHDIGKVAIPDHVLLKAGPLTDDERTIMQTHTVIGADTLRAVNKLHPTSSLVRMGIMIAEAHHEKWDGSGYPYGLRGTSIPLAARIVAVADVYDALTSDRCYKDAMPHREATSIMERSVGTHFDPMILEAFFQAESHVKAVRRAQLGDRALVY